MKANRVTGIVAAMVAAAWLGASVEAAKTKSAPSPLPGTMQGLVLHGGNAPVTGARVTLRAARGHHRGRGTRHVVTGPGGRFSMQVPAGRYLLLARKRGEGKAKAHVNVVAHQMQQKTLVLRGRHTKQHHHKHVKVKTAK